MSIPELLERVALRSCLQAALDAVLSELGGSVSLTCFDVTASVGYKKGRRNDKETIE